MLPVWLLAQAPPPVETNLTWPEIATGIAAVVVVGTALLGLLGWWIRSMIQREAKPARDALATSNGRTAGQLIEHTVRTVDSVDGRLQAVERMAASNQETSLAALALARESHERLDRHLTEHSREAS